LVFYIVKSNLAKVEVISERQIKNVCFGKSFQCNFFVES
jgi:hypothetical protein